MSGDVLWAQEDRVADTLESMTGNARVSIRSLELHPISVILTLRLQLLDDHDSDDANDNNSSASYKKGLIEEILTSFGAAATTLSSISGSELNLNALILKVRFHN